MIHCYEMTVTICTTKNIFRVLWWYSRSFCIFSVWSVVPTKAMYASVPSNLPSDPVIEPMAIPLIDVKHKIESADPSQYALILPFLARLYRHLDAW